MGIPLSLLTLEFAADLLYAKKGFMWWILVGEVAVKRWVLVVVFLAMVRNVAAQELRVLPAGQLPDDKRLGPLVTLEGYFPFSPPATKEAWAERAEVVRRQVLVATGLWPMPERTPPQAVIHGLVDRGD